MLLRYEEKEKKLAEEKAKKEAEEKAKKDKINTAKFEALYQIISGNKLEKMVNYIFNGNFDKSGNIENKYEVKIFNDNECIFGFSDSSNGYVKISFKKIDYNKIKLINEDNYFSLSIAALPNKEKAIDVKLNLENVSDGFKERITAFNSNFKEDTELSFKNFVIPLSNIKKYKEYVLNNSLLKIENELCK